MVIKEAPKQHANNEDDQKWDNDNGLEVIENLDIPQKQEYPQPGSPPPMKNNQDDIDKELQELDLMLGPS